MKQHTPDQIIMQRIRAQAEARYPRKLEVLARRVKWSRPKLSKVLLSQQPATLVELLTLCAAVGMPLSQALHAVGH